MKYIIISILCAILSTQRVHGQSNPSASSYYQNEYFSNPAQAGEDQNLNLSTAIKSQLTKNEGAPLSQYITADYGISKNVGLGISFTDEKAGLLKRSRFRGSYAYRLPLGSQNNEEIHFGIAGGIFYESFDLNKFKGDFTDITVDTYNQRPLSVDFDFGISYVNDNFNLQAFIPNLKSILKRDIVRNTVDDQTFFTSFSYRIRSYYNDAIDFVEPKIVYRGLRIGKGVLDLGLNLQFYDEKLSITSLYHSNKSLTIGLGTCFKENLKISAFYTSNMSQKYNYSNGEFEIALKYSIFRSGYDYSRSRDRIYKRNY